MAAKRHDPKTHEIEANQKYILTPQGRKMGRENNENSAVTKARKWRPIQMQMLAIFKANKIKHVCLCFSIYESVG